MVSYLVAQSQDIEASAERVWGGLRGFATCWWQHCSRASSSASMRRFFGKRDMMRVKCFGEKQTKKETDTIWHSQCWILELLSDSNVSESLLGDLCLLVVAKRRRREEEVNMINHYQSPQGFQDCALIVTSPATTRHQYHHCYHQVPLKNPNVWSQNPPSNEPIHDPPEPLIYYQYQTISSAMSITMKPDHHIGHCCFQFEPFPRVPRPIPRATNMHHIPGCRLGLHCWWFLSSFCISQT